MAYQGTLGYRGMTDLRTLRELVAWATYSNAVDNVPGDSEQERAQYRVAVKRHARFMIARMESDALGEAVL